MSINTFATKTKLCITLDPNSGTNIIPIFNYIPYAKSGYRLIDEYLEVNDLKAISWIYSLPKLPFPVFELEDSESKQLLAAINLEWKSERIQLDVVCQINGTLDWQRIAAFSLLNADPAPYREYSLGNHSLGNNSMIGLQIRAVGSGVLQNSVGGQDKVVVYGDLKRVITVEKLVDNSQKIVNSISTIAATIVNINLNRQGITFFNTSNINVYIDTNSNVSVNTQMVILEPGDYWEPPIQNYTGAYYGIVASGNTGIDIREFS